MGAYYLIGERLGHSFSPELHRAFGRYDYECKELAPGELAGFLRARDFAGLNVTIPYKQAVLPYLDRLEPQAAAIGAVNTVVNRDGLLWGCNTDFGGLQAALARAGLRVRGRRVLILGTGGSARTALAVCGALGAAQTQLVSRSEGPGLLSYAEAEALLTRPRSGRETLLLNCTPVGMWPRTEASPLPAPALAGLAGVFDCVYNPLRTELVQMAQAAGLPAAGGLYMLVQQAALACACFSGSPVPEAQTEELYRALARKRGNLVLIGMPGAGKSTVARLLAQNLDLKFVDTDETICRQTGLPIPELFAVRGEAGFRALETELVRSLSSEGGCVIATGGGTVLREENLRRLKQNGTLILLDRPLSCLKPSPTRPLADTPEKLARLYAERYAAYQSAADLTVPVTGTPSQTAQAIRGRLLD